MEAREFMNSARDVTGPPSGHLAGLSTWHGTGEHASRVATFPAVVT